jgi:hypothetical protein
MKKLLLYVFPLLVFASCENLDVQNTDAPSRSQIFENQRDLKVFTENIYITYWQAMHGTAYGNPQIAALTAADQLTSSWYNFGCYDLSIEPRKSWNNSPNYDYREITYSFYSSMYTVLYMSNTVINLINSGQKISTDSKINNGYLSFCYFMQGAALGQLGLTFDKAQVVKENTDIKNLKFIPYNQVIDSAIESLKKSVSITDTATFTLGSNIINGVTVDNKLLNYICHSYIARFMVLSARNKTENSAIDWAVVLEHAQKGIRADFGPLGDGNNKWYDEIARFITNTDNTQIFFCKVDNRIIHLFDPAYPERYWKNGKSKIVHTGLKAGEALSVDDRLKLYFEFSSGIRFYQERGTYHYSNYRFKRYDNIRTSGLGQLYDFSRYENYLYAIEAWIRTNKLSDAITALDAFGYPRHSKGNLPSINAGTDQKELLNILFYEREIELLGQGYLIGFCDMRRRDMLQKGTPLHFPVPGDELQTLELENYTFGGLEKADGVNTSNGGWE